jgi:peptide/nickel transport system permease protein
VSANTDMIEVAQNARHRSGWRRSPRRLKSAITTPGMVFSVAWLFLMIVFAVFAPLIAPHDPNAQNLTDPSGGPSTSHWLGTDDLGRDVLSRLIWGARTSLQVTFETVGIALIAALIIGLVAGYRGGRIDYVLMRVTDAGLAFPPLVLALAVVAVLGSSLNDTALALALVFAPGFARFIRGQTLAVKEEPFIEASVATGSPPLRIVLARIFPNVLTGLVVLIAIVLGAALLAESSLAFLGLGPPPPTASWGSMLQEAYSTSLYTHPWSLVPAGAAIALTVLSFNTIGDAVRDTLSGANAAKRRRHDEKRVKEQRGLTAVVRNEERVPTTEPDNENRPLTSALLEVRNLSVEFGTETGPVRVVDGVSFDVAAGRIVSLVGESGSGKTVSSLAILRLLPSPSARIVAGTVRFDGMDLLEANFESLRRIRGSEIAMVFQDPLASLDPAFTIGSQLTEAIRLHEPLSRKAAQDQARRLLTDVHIPDPAARLGAYPHQLSGGMRQRVMIAIALACQPRLLIADEPTTALDVTVQAQIVELFEELRDTRGLAVLFVTHDLALASDLSDEINVMYAGQIVEHGPTSKVFVRPRHPYTAALLAAHPGARTNGTAPILLGGQVPPAGHQFEGCRLHPRCIYAEDACRDSFVELISIGQDRQSRCRRLDALVLPGISRHGVEGPVAAGRETRGT